MAERASRTAPLKLLSWNIDGLDSRNLDERTSAVCSYIASSKPDIIYLQEVIPASLTALATALRSSYDAYSEPKERYFPAIMIERSRVSAQGELQVVDFPRSVMGRHLLQLPVKFAGVDLLLMTSHLESMKDYSAERKDQLRTAFGVMTGARKSKTCIFGGDLNVRDNEVKSVGVPPETVDVWEACGSKEEHKYSWDVGKNGNLDWPYPNKPKLRFDRVYLSPAHGQVQPKSFVLVGKDRLACGRFASDHWGLEVEFKVQ